jgi:hypothetical protein
MIEKQFKTHDAPLSINTDHVHDHRASLNKPTLIDNAVKDTINRENVEHHVPIGGFDLNMDNTHNQRISQFVNDTDLTNSNMNNIANLNSTNLITNPQSNVGQNNSQLNNGIQQNQTQDNVIAKEPLIDQIKVTEGAKSTS